MEYVRKINALLTFCSIRVSHFEHGDTILKTEFLNICTTIKLHIYLTCKCEIRKHIVQVINKSRICLMFINILKITKFLITKEEIT